MPLYSIPGDRAVEYRKTNPVAYWASSVERLAPVAKPESRPTFRLELGERIFTMGSCFARHVERELMERGFLLPARDLMNEPLFADVNFDVLNLYGTPSIY